MPLFSRNTLTKRKRERRLLTDGGSPVDISTEELRSRQFGIGETEKECEFRCPICDARCTEYQPDATELGHLTDCPRRPDEFPRRGKQYNPNNDALATDGGEKR
ncbi:hypothetical protein ACFQJD_06755 [Haloplanus sp. GCM10025708]|uniref:hypothetical protein n=1 Tax=Haloplanus sp. GCM10025708 TaxID=3252679 RepID=UPI003607A7B0